MQQPNDTAPGLVSPEELRLLAQVGLLAASHGDVASAEAIFSAVEAERPQALLAYVGLAMAYLNGERPADAVRCLERGLKAVADADRAEMYGFLGLALHVGGRAAESVKALRQAGDMPMAKAMLGEKPCVNEEK